MFETLSPSPAPSGHGKPEPGLEQEPFTVNGMPCRRHRLRLMRIARNVSLPRIGTGEPVATGLCEPIGRGCGTNVFLGRQDRQGGRRFHSPPA
ncbi:MAG: hypothetical protein FWD67_08755 [Betaproteobacteria bacterium]|nr:hypothetical protein [Betaproteobacteria bacterium]